MPTGRSSTYVAAAPRTDVPPKDMPDSHDPLRTLAKMAMGGGISGTQDIKSALVSYMESDDGVPANDAEATIRMLENNGYIRDTKKWLTRQGFEAVGSTLLHDIMKDTGMGKPGGHRTTLPGTGETTIDATRPYEPGDDISNTNVSATLLNSLRRTGSGIPLDISPQDIEQYITEADNRTAIVYCLDLSSTMRTRLRDGMSRMEAAKRSLWSLYTLNTRYYPNDTIHVVGFASMASVIRPMDIPYLETFTANDDFLHYTNYQAALRLARRILRREAVENRRIVMITDGQPSACFVESEEQRADILSEKPYSNFYAPDRALISKIESERGMQLGAKSMQVYLCYRYKGVDDRVAAVTTTEAHRCRRDHIALDYVVVSDEKELAGYARDLAAETRGRVYVVNDHGMVGTLVSDYVKSIRK